jgi:hypothetical protein
VSWRVTPLVAWLLAAQLMVDLVLVALLGFVVLRGRALMNALAKAEAGQSWAQQQIAQAFTSAATSIELSATAAAASSQAIQVLVRDVRPLVHARSTVATVDLDQLDLDQDT